MTCGNSINNKARTRVHVSTHKDIGLSSLIRLGISARKIASRKLNYLSLQKTSPLNGLSNRQDHCICLKIHCLLVIKTRRETLVIVKNTGTAFKHHAANVSLLICGNKSRSPTILD